MSTFGIFAFIVLPLLGGAIAWAGDVIGYRLGKSRRSLFGLRPRSTARLVGVAVGVALPLAGLLTAIAGSQEAKDALLHMDLLRQQQQQLTAQNQDLSSQNTKLQEQIARSQTMVAEGQKHIASLRSDLRGARGELTHAQSRLSDAHSRLLGAQRDVADLRSARQTLERASYLLQRRVTVLKEQSSRLEGNVRDVKRQLAVTRSDLDKVNGLLATTNAELNARQAELERQITSPIVFESGHELLRVILDVGDSVQETEANLTKVLGAASEVAAANGAGAVPNGLAVRLVKGLPPDAATRDEHQILINTANELQKAGKRKWVIIVRTMRRMYAAERVQAQVELYPLPYVLVFAKDEVIYSVVIDGSKPRADIFTELYNLVTKLVRREAQGHGLLRDPATQGYGSLSATELLHAFDAIAAAGRPTLVEVKAARDTYIIPSVQGEDPLSIRIEIKPAENASRAYSPRG